MKYKGIYISETLEKGRTEVSIETSAKKITISYDENVIELPIETLLLERGGSGKQLIYLKNKLNGISVYTREKGILKDEFLTSNALIKKESNKLRLGILQSRIFALTILFIIIFIPLSFFLFKSFYVDAIAKKIPVKWEKDIGDELFSAVKLQYNIVEDSTISAKLDSIFAPVIYAAHYPEINFKFHVCEDPTLNAFALPGGHIVINTGTIYKIERIEELHGVLAHEIAHVTKRHHLRGLIGKAGIFLIFQGLIGDEAGLIGAIGESAGHLNSLFYSREYETEADTTGFNYLTKANIDPHGMVEFFERIEKEYENTQLDSLSEKTKGLSSYLSTHPDTKNRIASLEQLMEKQDSEFHAMEYTAKQLQEFIDQQLDQ